MFESIKKAKQLGALALRRVDDYRILSAWGVVGIYALIAFLVYAAAPKQTVSVSAFDVVRDELQQDIKLMKDVV